jgi:hypothetical protein
MRFPVPELDDEGTVMREKRTGELFETVGSTVDPGC